MNKFYAQDTVQFGVRGKVRYQVAGTSGDQVQVRALTTGRLTWVSEDRLVLIEGGQERFAAAAQARKDAITEAEPVRDPIMPVRENMFSQAEQDAITRDIDEDQTAKAEPLTGTVVKLVPERSSYSKAILAGLQAKAGHVFEGVSLSPKARAKRKAARRAAKISRKANR